MRTRHNAFASPPLPSAPRPGDTILPGSPAAPPFDLLTNRDPAPSNMQSTAHSDMAQVSPSTSQRQFLSPSPMQEALFLPAPQFTNPHPGHSKSSSLPGTPVNISAIPNGTLIYPADNISQPLEVTTLLQPALKTQSRKRTKPADGDYDTAIGGSNLLHQAELAAAAGDSGRPGLGRSGGPTTGSCANDQLERAAGPAESSAHVRFVRQRKNSATVPALSAATAPKDSYIAEANGAAAVAVTAQRALAGRKHAAAAAEMNPKGSVQGRNPTVGGAASRPGQRKRPKPNARASRR